MSTGRLKKYMLALLALGSLLGLTVGFRSFIMANVIEPIAILFWAAWRIISSVNQHIYWIFMIIVCSFLMFRLVRSGNGSPSRQPGYYYSYRRSSRVAYWQALIRDTVLRKNDGEYLRDNLRQLFVSFLAQMERSEPTDLEGAAATGKKPLSLQARRFLFSSVRQSGMISMTPAWLRRWAGKFIPQDTTAIAEILEYMETEMEMNHER